MNNGDRRLSASHSSSQQGSYTYLGTVDDVVFRYPWDIPVDLKYLNDLLLRKAVMGERIVLNDGYLLNLPAARQALLEPSKSPLKFLIEQGFVRILSRQQTLAGLPVAMAHAGVESFAELLRSPEWQGQLKPLLTRWDAYLQEYNRFLPWPRKDISHGFCLMMRRLQGKTAAELGLASVDDDLLQRVLDKFLEQSEQSHDAARTRWEKLVLELCDQAANAEAAVREMMRLANQVYHYNFGICLTAGQVEEPEGRGLIAVETRYNPAFADLLKIEPGMETVDLEVPALKLPKRVPMDSRQFWEELIRPDTDLGEKRAIFTQSYENYLAGLIDLEQLKDAVAEYSSQLFRHCGEAEPNSKAAQLGKTALSLGFLGAGTVLGGPVMAVLLWVAENAAVPTVMKVLRRTSGAVEMPLPATPQVGAAAVPETGGTRLTSVSLDPDKAAALAAGINDFG